MTGQHLAGLMEKSTRAAFRVRDGLEIMDRVGGGRFICLRSCIGLMTFEDAEKAVNYGAAHGALAMTTPGDTTMASLAS